MSWGIVQRMRRTTAPVAREPRLPLQRAAGIVIAAARLVFVDRSVFAGRDHGTRRHPTR